MVIQMEHFDIPSIFMNLGPIYDIAHRSFIWLIRMYFLDNIVLTKYTFQLLRPNGKQQAKHRSERNIFIQLNDIHRSSGGGGISFLYFLPNCSN